MRLTILILTAMITGCLNANPVTWKERESTVSAVESVDRDAATNPSDAVLAKPEHKVLPKIKLSTGQEATVVGGVYVSAEDPSSILVWALQNGYEARKDKYMNTVIHIDAAPHESVSVASRVSVLPGVKTAAPNYRVAKVKK